MKLLKIIPFLLFYIKEVVLSNFIVAADILSPRLRATPEIVEIPLEPERSDLQLYILSCLVTMTPGTLTVDISPDKDIMTLHVMYAANPEAVIAHIKHNYERRVCDVVS